MNSKLFSGKSKWRPLSEPMLVNNDNNHYDNYLCMKKRSHSVYPQGQGLTELRTGSVRIPTCLCSQAPPLRVHLISDQPFGPKRLVPLMEIWNYSNGPIRIIMLYFTWSSDKSRFVEVLCQLQFTVLILIVLVAVVVYSKRAPKGRENNGSQKNAWNLVRNGLGRDKVQEKCFLTAQTLDSREIQTSL